MTTDPKNQQSALKDVAVGHDLTIENLTQTINYYDRPNDLQSERVTHERGFYHNLSDRDIDRKGIFVGREDDLAKLHEMLQGQASQSEHLPTVLIVGMAGMGKSELARQYGKLHLDDFAGGVGIVNAAQFGEEIRDFMQLRFCEDRDLRYGRTLKAQVAEGWQAWQRFCGAARAALIVIDDVTNYQEQVAPYLPSLPKNSDDRCPFRFVLTARSQLRCNLELHEIKELTTDAAVQVLTKWAEPNQQTVNDHLELARSLCDRLGCLPLAITLVGSWLSETERTLPMAIAALEEQGLASAILEPERDDTRQKAELGLRAAFAMSWQPLTEDARQLGRVLSLFEPIDLPWELVESAVKAYPQRSAAPPIRKGWWQRFWDSLGQLVGLLLPFLRKSAVLMDAPFVPIRNLREARIALRKMSLLQSVEQGKTYRLHRLVHEFLALQWEGADREGWQEAWLRGLSDRADEIPAFASWELVTAWQPLRPHFISAQKFIEARLKSANNPALVDIYKLPRNNLIGGIFRLSQAPIFEATYRQAISTHDRAKAALKVGDTAAAQSYFGEAIKGYQRAIEQARVALPENSMILAGYLHAIAILLDELGNYNDALVSAQESVQICRAKGHTLQLAYYLHIIGRLYRLLGVYEKAEEAFIEAIKIKKNLLGENHNDVAHSLNSLAVVYTSQGKYNKAESLFTQALHIREKILGDSHLEVAICLSGLAINLVKSQNSLIKAENLLIRAIDIYEKQKATHYPDIAFCFDGLALIYSSQGKYNEATHFYMRALHCREAHLGSDHPFVAASLVYLTAHYFALKLYPQALECIQRAIQICAQKLGAQHPDTQAALSWLQTIRAANKPSFSIEFLLNPKPPTT